MKANRLSLNLPLQRSPGAGGVGLFIAVLLGALLLGLMAAVLPWWLIVALFLLPSLAVLAWVRQDLAVLATIALMCGVIPESVTPSVSLGPGQVKAHELALGLMLLLAAMRNLRERTPPDLRRLQWPVLAMLGLMVTGMVVGWLVSGAPPKDILSEARNQLGWLLMFVIVGLVRSERDLDRIVYGLVFLGCVIASLVVVQSVTGKALLQEARVEQLTAIDGSSEGVTRALAGGGIYILIFSLLFLCARVLTSRASIAWAAPVLCLLAAGLVVTFGRGIWIATLVAAVALAWSLRRLAGVAILSSVLAVVALAAVVAVTAFKPALAEAAVNRLLSTTQETFATGTTLGWRAEEAAHALKAIAANPLTGAGLGAPYKPLTMMNGRTITDQDVLLTRYIHNAYVGLWLKLGLFALPVAAWIVWLTYVTGRKAIAVAEADARDVAAEASNDRTRADERGSDPALAVTEAFLSRASRRARQADLAARQRAHPHRRCIVVAAMAAFGVIMMTSVTQPEWLWQPGTASLALLIALILLVRRVQGEREPVAARTQRPRRTPRT